MQSESIKDWVVCSLGRGILAGFPSESRPSRFSGWVEKHPLSQLQLQVYAHECLDLLGHQYQAEKAKMEQMALVASQRKGIQEQGKVYRGPDFFPSKNVCHPGEQGGGCTVLPNMHPSEFLPARISLVWRKISSLAFTSHWTTDLQHLLKGIVHKFKEMWLYCKEVNSCQIGCDNMSITSRWVDYNLHDSKILIT